MRGWLAAMLDQRVVRVRVCEGLLLRMGEVEVIDGEDYCGEIVGRFGECVAEGFDLVHGTMSTRGDRDMTKPDGSEIKKKTSTYQCRLAGSLYTIESEEEGWRLLALLFMLLFV